MLHSRIGIVQRLDLFWIANYKEIQRYHWEMTAYFFTTLRSVIFNDSIYQKRGINGFMDVYL